MTGNGKEPEEELVEILSTEISQIATSSLSVHVDYLELVDRYDEDKAWEVLTDLKGLLG